MDKDQMPVKTGAANDVCDIGKYKKKKSQTSKSKNRSDHKHQYVKSIIMIVSPYDGKISAYRWATNCEICGRLGKIDAFGCDDFLKPEFKGKHIAYGPHDILLPFSEIRAKYPEIPVYRDDPEHWGKYYRVR